MKGYDHAFLLDAKGDASQPAAQVWSQDGKLQMTVYTSRSGAAVLLRQLSRRHPVADDGALRRLAGTGAGERIPAGFAEPSAMAAAGLCITSARVRQPDGISVYRPIIASALHQGRCFRPRPPLCRLFFSNLLYFPSPKDKKITCVLQAPYTAPLFSLWLDKHCRAPNHGNIMRIVINQ